MNAMAHSGVPLQNGKKMKKRKELDALVSKNNVKRCGEGAKRSSGSGSLSSHDKLLSDSTDDQDYWVSPTGERPLWCHRRNYFGKKRTCSALLKTCSFVFILTSIFATVTVMWLFIDVKEQVTSLRMELNQVVAGIQGVPDALQKCHALSKDLQKNQSQIMNRLNGFSILLTNFSLEISESKSNLQTVQEQLKSSPDLVNNPRLVKDLSASVASFGSQIRDLNTTVFTLKDQSGKMNDVLGNLVTNLTAMKVKLTQLSNADASKAGVTQVNLTMQKEAILALVRQVSGNLSAVNDTLSNKLQWTSQEQSKDHSQIENLREASENLLARIKTLEGLCAKDPKPKMFSTPENFVDLEESSKPKSESFQPPSAQKLIVSDPNMKFEVNQPKTFRKPP